MHLGQAADLPELVAELRMQLVGVVADDLEIAAPLWTLRTESGDEDVAPGFDRTSNRRHVPPALSLVAQEVEHGAVVPEVV